VAVEMVPSGKRQTTAGQEWAAWAGEPIEKVGRR
jgi:hypothetical protein